MDRKILGALASFVVTKGLDNEERKVVNIDNPMYFVTDELDTSATSSKDKSHVFAEMKSDMIDKFGDEDLEAMESAGLITLEDVNDITFDTLDFDINEAVVDLRVSKEILEACEKFGEFIVLDNKIKKSPKRYYFQNKRNAIIPLMFFPNKKNNIGVIRQDNGSDLYFLDGFVNVKESIMEKNQYVNELILLAYLSVMQNGVFFAEGINNGIAGTLRNIYSFFVYGGKIKYQYPKVSYVSMLGGRNRETWKLRADVIDSLKGEICWLKETERFDSIIAEVETIASNPKVAVTSMTQGGKFMLMNTPEEARKWESQFTQGKYDISATILPTMKCDKDIEKYNIIFGTIVNNKDNNQYGNALWQRDYAGKTYCVVNGVVIRVKYSTQKATSDIVITDNNGNDIQDWIIAPVSEMSSEKEFIQETKMDNILQLIHMGLTPEAVVITVEGVSYQAIMFRDVPQYVDYLTSSDYNVDKSFELKPYSSMMSCISNHIATTMGVDKLDEFRNRLTGLINQNKLNALANLAGKKLERAEAFAINK